MRIALGLLVLCLAACGAQLGDDDGVAARPDARSATPDALQQRQPDAAPMVTDNACGVASTQGDLGMLSGTAGSQTQSSTTTKRVSYVQAVSSLTLNQNKPDVIYIELWDGYGVFNGGSARAGTYTISGAETDFDTCGLCVLTLADVSANTPTKYLMATSGTVTITSVGTAAGQTTQATLSNVSFTEITQVNQDWQAVAGSTCTSPISHADVRGSI